ncbi:MULTISPECIES: helix-turn-helix transcriptional regulator [unclassified Streptomyces]|uniref:helix-turn-helix transcriptional regulator n=1 Tax=unclassified Streptomyces TaxID=2593676 RepID=UPI000AD8246E|nr:MULTISPECIES: helix-turn-helix domain-containing protein [unclassified Streptomyces]
MRRIDAVVDADTLPPPRVRQQLRLAGGLTQAEVAEVIGVKRVAVARWEAGLTQPHRNNRLKYAELLRRLAEEHPAAVREVPGED